MAERSLEQIRWIRLALLAMRRWSLRRFLGLSIGDGVVVSLTAQIICRRRGTISIGDDSLVAFKTLITTLSESDPEERPVTIGARCFIGGGAVVGPGVSIGDDCIIGAGSVVLESIPGGSLVGGNPARIIRSGLTVRRARDEFLFG
jgi:exopolysaccharide acyltransferase PssR